LCYSAEAKMLCRFEMWGENKQKIHCWDKPIAAGHTIFLLEMNRIHSTFNKKNQFP
jgi:hypothetical protein